MKVTYLDHSGFMVTTEDVIMVFDYYRDPSHSVVKTLEKHPELPVVFFVSHHHKDHYNTDIFNLGQSHERLYVMSNDVFQQHGDSKIPTAGMSAGDRLENVIGGLTVDAFGSTDMGVSFAVTDSHGKKIFHAGDLNNWHWSEDSTPKEVQKASLEFEKVLHRVKEKNDYFDVAFFPVDPRQGKDYASGAAQFLDSVKVKDFFPMHFFGDHDKACDFKAYPIHEASDTAFHCLYEPGQSMNI